ncbi:MAG: hypothetical protein OR994_08320, partial [Candidatus Poseidoniales archaeon]|nr:hypothetical protein [Candidatus Poseidoniales archaeon]
MQKGVAQYMGEVVVAITGASGAIYGKRLTECLTNLGVQVRLVVTASGELTLAHECQTDKETIAANYSAILEDG